MLIGVIADERKDIEHKIEANGGQYKPNLTKEETHLIAKEPVGAKYDFAARWGIKTVAIEWLKQSLERRMILEEKAFHPGIPAEKRGVGAWIRKSSSTSSLGKRGREPEGLPDQPRKLRRTISAKLEREHSGIWGDIASYEVKTVDTKERAWDDEGENASEDVKRRETLSNHEEKPAVREPAISGVDMLLGNSRRKDEIFYNKSFALFGFEDRKASILEGHLRSKGGNIMEFDMLMNLKKDVEVKDFYLLIPHHLSPRQIPRRVDESLLSNMGTELWIERCILRKEFEDPAASITNKPFQHFPIPDFKDLKVHSTGFQGIELSHMCRAVKLMGASYSQDFNSGASLLLCNATNKGTQKLSHAQLWSIPAVQADWLWDCIKHGKLMPYDPHLIQPISPLIVENPDTLKSKTVDRSEKSRQWSSEFERIVTPKPNTSFKISSADEVPTKLRNDPPFTKSDKINRTSYPDDTGPRMQPNEIYESFDGALDTPMSEEPSSHAILKKSSSLPLQEITPNSSPPKQSSHPKETIPSPSSYTQPQRSFSPPKPPTQQNDESLGPTISSLLAHHQQRASSALAVAANKSASNLSAPNSPHPPRCRRRQLLGRAPSNLSSHSLSYNNKNNNPNFSRASSVDTLHTDGLGTPLSASSFPFTNKRESAGGEAGGGIGIGMGSGNCVVYDEGHEEEKRKQEECLQMTQLGYEDSEVRLWRERVDRKIGGGGGNDGPKEKKVGGKEQGEIVDSRKEGKGEGDVKEEGGKVECRAKGSEDGFKRGKAGGGRTPGRPAGGAGGRGGGVRAKDEDGGLGISRRTRLATSGR